VIRTYDDDDDENDVKNVGTDDKQRLDVDEPPSALMIALQQKKAEKRNKKKAKAKRKLGSGTSVLRSFDTEEADEYDDKDDDQHNRKKKKKRKKGLGFGGGESFAENAGDARKEDEMEGSTTNAYGKEALEQLKSEQKRQTVPRAPLQSTTTTGNSNSIDVASTIRNGDESTAEESFIPLDDDGGDNGTSFENHGRNRDQEKDQIFVVDDPLQEESRGWERQIEQRAGLKPSSQSSRPTTSKLLSVDELSKKLKSTVETIDRQREELENSTNRLRADREHARSNSKEHQDRLKQTGLACEFYQSTRRDLTLWVGALRDLDQKIEPISTAFCEMLLVQSKEFCQEFRSWQDDCVATLYQNHRLDRVLGRQPESTLFSTASNETVIDEFGRDIGSQYLRDREMRFKNRIDYIISNENANNGEIIQRENHDEGERSKLLQQALNAALEDLDQEYTSAIGLKSIFDGWFAAYYDDFQQCFATLSFGDLYAVLVQVELHQSKFFSDILSTANYGTDTRSIRKSQSPILALDECLLDSPKEEEKEEEESKTKNGETKVSKIEKENAGRLARAVDKGVLPILVNILSDEKDKDHDNSFYLFFSTTKSLLLSRLANDALQQGVNRSRIDHGGNTALNRNLQNLISNAIKRALEDVSIPLLNKCDDKATAENNADKKESLVESPSEALDYSVRFSRLYLVQILQQFLCNIIMDWFPLLDLDIDSDSNGDEPTETGIHFVLTFLNDKYLVLISSMVASPAADSLESPSAKDCFQPIWQALRADSRNILESPSLMLLTMPLRAAALAYQLD